MYSRKSSWKVSIYLIHSRSVSRICHEIIFSRINKKECFSMNECETLSLSFFVAAGKLNRFKLKNTDIITTCAVYLKLCQRPQSSANDGLVVL